MSGGAPTAAFGGLPPDQRVLTEIGYQPIGELREGKRVVTGAQQLCRVVAILRRDVRGGWLYRVRTAAGNLLRASGSQCVLARRQEGIPNWVPLWEVESGDLLAIVGGVALGWEREGFLRMAYPVRPVDGTGAFVAVEERSVYRGVNWVPVYEVDGAPYCGPLISLQTDSEHGMISDGVVVADGS